MCERDLQKSFYSNKMHYRLSELIYNAFDLSHLKTFVF